MGAAPSPLTPLCHRHSSNFILCVVGGGTGLPKLPRPERGVGAFPHAHSVRQPGLIPPLSA